MKMTFLLKWVSLQRQDLLLEVTVVHGSVARYEQRFAATDYVSELFKGNQFLLVDIKKQKEQHMIMTSS